MELHILVLELLLAACAIAVLHYITSPAAAEKKEALPLESEAAAPLPRTEQAAAQQQTLTVFYASLKGTSRQLAEHCAEQAWIRGFDAKAVDLATYDQERLAQEETLAVFVVATYTEGTPPPGTEAFFADLLEATHDFRVGAGALSHVRYAVFGCGNSEYPKRYFNAVARRTDQALRALGGKRMLRRCEGDNLDNRLHEQFDAWLPLLWDALSKAPPQQQSAEAAAKQLASDKAPAKQPQPPYLVATAAEAVEPLVESDDDEDEGEAAEGVAPTGAAAEGLADLEDLGVKMAAGLAARDEGEKAAGAGAPKQMVTPSLRKALTKQGYKVIGSHSGVKLCRWTKAMLRGRGGCYKHTFYGIVSYQCMEATPSLACANKCVFCWRHHDNPVGTSFRWEVDDPQALLDGFERSHLDMIKQLRGVPGVLPERFAEAVKAVRHCALSLVGEPIIYPRINEFLDLMHAKGISSFMVTNAQFPEQMETLRPCTQLYISIDGADKDELKAVDRPLFGDFWERFLTCVDMLREKKQRTVFRLTLVNGWNDAQLEKYVELVRRGRPDFIEIKGVTYCGDSKASPLTIKHCPYHAQVREYCLRMAEALEHYDVASEHAHSNCVLIAHHDFRVDGQWHTWVDFDRFTELAKAGQPFGSKDYMAPTPAWAVYDPDATDGGFDPAETRYVRKAGAKPQQGC